MNQIPQYLYDPKTNQIVVQQTTSSVKPVTEDVGSNRQENGLEADFYIDEVEDSSSSEEKNEKKSSYVQQKPGKTTLGEVYPNTTTITNTDFEELNDNMNRDEDNNPTKKMLELLERSVWIHVQMPQEFEYTGAILTKNAINGLMHTFVRHSNQWQTYIPSLSPLIEKLPAHIRELITNVQDQGNRETARNAIENLNKELQNLQNRTYIDTVFLEIQLILVEFLKGNVISEQYLEEGVNNRGQIQVYFKVTNSSGATEVMVVCVSEQLYPSIRDFDDPRPVRTITTVFFKTWNEYVNSNLRVGKAWPRK